MEIMVKCQVCNKKIAKFSCKKCGVNCCEDCFDKNKNICIVCSRGLIYKKT